LVHTPKEAVSKTEWSKRGYRVLRDAVPHAQRTAGIFGRGSVSYPVYRADQVEPKRRMTAAPPAIIDVLAAVWVLNRRARRCRDLARSAYKDGRHQAADTHSREKRELYQLKGKVLHHLVAEGLLRVDVYHGFPKGN
jgi:hypothetical protein